jgi:hypothetical protein
MNYVFRFSADGSDVSVIRASCEMYSTCNVGTVMSVRNFDRGPGV